MEKLRADQSEGGQKDEFEHFSTVLCALWDSYHRFLHLGMLAAGATIAIVWQFLKDASFVDPSFGLIVKLVLVLAGFSGICFASCRWLSQVLMERQVYGPAGPARAYFESCETRAPNALWYSARILSVFYKVNDFFKFAGAFSLTLSWILIVYFLFSRVEDLLIAPNYVEPSDAQYSFSLFHLGRTN